MPDGNIFLWVLIGFPVYLLFKARISTYLALATRAQTTATPTSAPITSVPATGATPATIAALSQQTGISTSTLNAIPTQVPALNANTAGNFT